MGQISLNGQALALHNISNNGMVYRTGASTFTSLTTGGIAAGNFPDYTTVPATVTSTGSPGEIAVNSTHFYVCTAANRWGRVAIQSF